MWSNERDHSAISSRTAAVWRSGLKRSSPYCTLQSGKFSGQGNGAAETTVMKIDFTADTARSAARGANAFAAALLSYRAEQSASDQKRQLVALHERIRSVEAQLATACHPSRAWSRS
jgi:hypothetical protein